jgi:hypothetical protein
MEIDQRKVSLISKFLEESFIGWSVYDRQDADRDAQFFRIVDDTSGKVVHRVFVARTFLDAHGADYIIPALKELAFLVCLRIAGGRSVIVKSQMIEIEKGIARGDVDPRAPDDVVSWVERVRVKPESRSRPSIRLSRHQVPDDRLDRHQRRARPG